MGPLSQTGYDLRSPGLLLKSKQSSARPKLNRSTQRKFQCRAEGTRPVQEKAHVERKVSKFGKGGLIPQRLLRKRPEGGDMQMTVYTLRFTTAVQRGSSLDEPNAAVHVCLVSEDGSAILQRIPPVSDAQAMQAELSEIQQVMNADGKSRKATSFAVNLPDGHARFQSGNVDEISFLGPELGPIKSVLVSPENGSWRLDELTVVSSRSNHTDRFLCGKVLGSKEGAGFLTPVPEYGVVYGTGESAAIITRAEARALHEAGMGKYSLFKERLLQTNATLVGVGTGLGWTFCGDEVALEFGCGGLAGLIYMWLLQTGVDRVGLRTSPPKVKASGAGESFLRLIGSGGFRIVALAGISVACAIYGTQAREVSLQHSTASLTQAQEILVGVAGFMMYKVATIGVLTVPPLFQLDERK